MSISPGTTQKRVRACHVALERGARSDHLERRPRRVQAGGGKRTDGVDGSVLRDGENLPGRRFDHHDHRLATLVVHRVLSGVLHGPVQADRDRRGRRRLHLVQHRDVDVVLVDADHPPARLAVEFVDHGLLHLTDQRRGEVVVGRQQLGLRGNHHAGQVADRRGDVVVVVGAQRDQIHRLARRAGLLGQPLRVVERVVERVQRVDDRAGRGDQVAAGPGSVQRVVVEVAGSQHVGAADFVHRGTPRRVGPQRERLMLAEAWMQVGGAPPDLPMAFVASHFQLAVVGPGPVLRQMPGVAIAHRADVLGVLRAENLGVQVAGLQPGPRRVERFARVAGVVAELGGRRGVAGGQRSEEPLGRRRGALRPRSAGRHGGRRDKHRQGKAGS